MTWVEFPTHNMNDWFKHKLYVNRDHRLSRTVGGGQNAKVLLPTHHQSTRPTYWASHTIVIWLGLCCQDEWIQEDARLVGPWPHDIHSNMEAGKRIGHTEEHRIHTDIWGRERRGEAESPSPWQPMVQQRGGGNWRHILATCGKQKQNTAWVRAVPSAVKQTRFVYNHELLKQSCLFIISVLCTHSFPHTEANLMQVCLDSSANPSPQAQEKFDYHQGELLCLCWDYSLFVDFSAEGLDLNS